MRHFQRHFSFVMLGEIETPLISPRGRRPENNEVLRLRFAFAKLRSE
jgi:hypothetical protein